MKKFVFLAAMIMAGAAQAQTGVGGHGFSNGYATSSAKAGPNPGFSVSHSGGTGRSSSVFDLSGRGTTTTDMTTFAWNQSTGSGDGAAFSTGNTGATAWQSRPGAGGQAYSTALGVSEAGRNTGIQTYGGGISYFEAGRGKDFSAGAWNSRSYAGTERIVVDGKTLTIGTGGQTASGNASAYTKYDFSTLD